MYHLHIRSDTQRIFVDVGLGFHVEFTWSEGLNFIALREEKRARRVWQQVQQLHELLWHLPFTSLSAHKYTCLIAAIKPRINLVCEGIREFLQLPADKSLPERLF